jgi:hypothetical protein
MRNPLRAARRLALASLVALAAVSSVPAQLYAGIPTEKTLPASTVFYFKVDDASKLRDALKATQFGQLIADPALKPLKDDFAAKLDDTSKTLKEKVGVTLGELLTLPQGPVCVAALARDDVKVPIAVLLCADAGKKAGEMEGVLARATKLAEEDSTVSTETFKDMKLTVIRSKKKEDGKEEPPLIWTKQGTVFHIATDLDALKDTLSHPTSRDGALESSDSYSALQKKVGKGTQAFWYVDVAQILKIVGQKAGAQGGAGNAGQIEAQLQLLGLNNLKSIGAGVTLNTPEYDQITKTYIYAPGPAQGLLKVFSMPKADLKPQSWVPASVASYQSISWDLDAAYEAINDLADMFAPGMLANLEKQIPGPNGEDFSFQKDVFGPLGNRLTVIGDYKKSSDSKTPAATKPTDEDQRILFAVALQDAKTFQNTLNKLIAIAKANPKKRDFQGVTIYDFDMPEVPNAPPGAVQGPISVAIAKEQLFASLDPKFLEQVLRTGGPSLADTPAFQAVAKKYPDKTSTFNYQRPEENARVLFDAVKSGQLKKALENAKGKNGEDLSKLGDLIDPTKLPEFSVFAKYLAPSGGFGIPDEDGVTFTSFTVKKAAP